MVSFTVAGKNATQDECKRYAAWDRQSRERNTMIESINKNFPDLSVCKSGDTSIDIAANGFDKSQIVKYFDQKDHVIFIGGDVGKYGSNNTLVKEIENTNNKNFNTVQVHNWNDAFKYLMNEK